MRQPDRFHQPSDTTIYGVQPGHFTFWQVGFQALAQVPQPLGPNADLKARYVLFVDYGWPRLINTSHRLDLMVTAKINTLLNVTLGGIVLHDYN